MKIKTTLFLFCLFISEAKLKGDVDCLDNSWHLKQSHDAKEYHLAGCNHNCYTDRRGTITNDRGYCTICRHYRDARPFHIVTRKEEAPQKPAPYVDIPTRKRRSLEKSVSALGAFVRSLDVKK